MTAIHNVIRVTSRKEELTPNEGERHHARQCPQKESDSGRGRCWRRSNGNRPRANSSLLASPARLARVTVELNSPDSAGSAVLTPGLLASLGCADRQASQGREGRLPGTWVFSPPGNRAQLCAAIRPLWQLQAGGDHRSSPASVPANHFTFQAVDSDAEAVHDRRQK